MHQRDGPDKQADGPADSWCLTTDQIFMKFYGIFGCNPGTNQAAGRQTRRTITLLNIMFGKP